jgi:hypothetical protein
MVRLLTMTGDDNGKLVGRWEHGIRRAKYERRRWRAMEATLAGDVAEASCAGGNT